MIQNVFVRIILRATVIQSKSVYTVYEWNVCLKAWKLCILIVDKIQL
jgi:hypothetical protein